MASRVPVAVALLSASSPGTVHSSRGQSCCLTYLHGWGPGQPASHSTVVFIGVSSLCSLFLTVASSLLLPPTDQHWAHGVLTGLRPGWALSQGPSLLFPRLVGSVCLEAASLRSLGACETFSWSSEFNDFPQRGVWSAQQGWLGAGGLEGWVFMW